MLTKTVFLFIFIFSSSMKYVVSRRDETAYSLRQLFENILEERRNFPVDMMKNDDEYTQLLGKRAYGVCQDASSWSNGQGFGCTEYGTALPGVKNSPWCQSGAIVVGAEWTVGAKYNYPEKNCCVCGGGCRDTLNWGNGQGFGCTEYRTALPGVKNSPWCQSGAIVVGAEWTVGAKYNYPEKNCCACGGGCRDTPNWQNGLNYTCTHYGTTSSGIWSSPWCQSGAIVAGAQWAMGAKYNYPEKNCCVCGKAN